jgi:hypothetical protein
MTNFDELTNSQFLQYWARTFQNPVYITTRDTLEINLDVAKGLGQRLEEIAELFTEIEMDEDDDDDEEEEDDPEWYYDPYLDESDFEVDLNAFETFRTRWK